MRSGRAKATQSPRGALTNVSLSWLGAQRSPSPKIKATEGGINQWSFLYRGTSFGKGCQQPMSISELRVGLNALTGSSCPCCRGKPGQGLAGEGGAQGKEYPDPPLLPPLLETALCLWKKRSKQLLLCLGRAQAAGDTHTHKHPPVPGQGVPPHQPTPGGGYAWGG